MSEQVTDFDRDGMTFWGDSISAQVRHDSSGEYLALYAVDEAELDVDNAVILRGDDVEKLKALIAEAEKRHS